MYHEELGRLQAASVTASMSLKSPEGSLDTEDIVKKEDEEGRQEENKPKPSPFQSSKVFCGFFSLKFCYMLLSYQMIWFALKSLCLYCKI